MSDKLDPVLLMFHQIRRETQIAKRLRTKLREYNEHIQSMGEALVMFAPWKKGNLLYRDGMIWCIHKVYLEEPAVTDMRPMYTYEVDSPAGKIDIPLFNDQGMTRIYAKDCIKYRKATIEDVQKCMETLSPLKGKIISKLTGDYTL